MSETAKKIEHLNRDLEDAKQFFHQFIKDNECPVNIYTHIDSDGLSSGAILGKALYREKIPFQIRILKQLEKEEIIKIAIRNQESERFLIFSDFGSGQYTELQDNLQKNSHPASFLILDHHLPQNIADKEQSEEILKIYEESRPWHFNPYFYEIDGSYEISGAGMCYYFAKCLNKRNIDLSPIAIVGATGDIQNRGTYKSFEGANLEIVSDAKQSGLLETLNDLSFSSITPLNEAIAYSYDINLPGLTDDVNRTLKFLQSLGILMENTEGNIRSLDSLSQQEKQKVTSALIEYASIKLDIEPSELVEKLIANKHLLSNEKARPDLYYISEFSYLLNACGRTDNGAIGIAIAMGDRKDSYQKGHEIMKVYKNSLFKGMLWVLEKKKIQEMEYIQYYFGEDAISEKIIGVIASMLVFDDTDRITKNKPIFGIANREGEDIYKISGRAHRSLVEKGVNLSEAIRKALDISDIDALGGGHPPAAGTKVPIDKIDLFLKNMNEVIKNQLKK